MATGRVRLFVAIPLDDAARARLAAAVDGMRASTRGAAWVAQENVHLTLKFLGGVEAGRIDSVTRALAAAAARVRPFSLEIKGLGAFPSASRARVIWAGVGRGSDDCVRAAASVERAIAPLGFPTETRGFSPHVTLGRVREPRRDERLATLLHAGAGVEFGTVAVSALSLMRSDLSPRGARYTELGSCPLG